MSGMNLIDYNQVMEALDKERQFLLNREQYGAENVLVHHAINVISELRIVRQPKIVRCKDCKHYHEGFGCDLMQRPVVGKDLNWFCADGEKAE